MRDKANPQGEVSKALAPLHKRMQWQQHLAWLGKGTAGGLFSGAVVLGIAHLTPLLHAWLWAVAVAVLVPFGVFIYSFLHLPGLSQLVRRLDAEGWQERISTAYELEHDPSPFARLQRADALAAIARIDPVKIFPLKPGRRDWQLVGGACLCLILMLVLPNPMDHMVAHQAAFKQETKQQIAQMEKVKEEIAKSGLPADEKQRLVQALTELQRQLRRAKDAEQALKALSQTQEQLQQISRRQLAQAAALAQLAQTLQQNAHTVALGKKLAAKDYGQAQAIMEEMAEQLAEMNDQAKAALAATLQQAAVTKNLDAGLQAALTQAAANLRSLNVAEAAQQLQAAAVQLGQQGNQAAAAGQLAQAIGAIQSGKVQLAAASGAG